MRTMGLVLVALVPALALMFYTAAEQRQLDARHAQIEAERQASLTAADQAQQVIGARQLLQLLERLPAVRASDAAACSELLARLLAHNPAFSNITVMQPDGGAICSAPTAKPGANFADRAYFRRAVESRQFAAGDYIIGRITGKPTIDFAHPVIDRSGRIVQVLALGIDLTWLNSSLATGQWPAGTTLTLVDQTGTVVGSYPDASRLGKPLGATQSERMLVGRATVDGGTPGAGMRVMVGIPEDVAFASADGQLIRNLVLFSAALALALLAAWALGSRLIVRPVRALGAVAQRFSAGDLSARAGPHYAKGELGTLGRAFDEMAEALQAAYLNTIRVLASAIGLRDPGGLEHSTRVARYAVAFARALRWDESRLIPLEMGATLHDVGKIGVPDAVLRKEGSLDPDERSLVCTHPAAGAHLLERVPFLDPARDCVRCHHEHYDGHGYPDTLAADEIPIDARIVAIVDAFDVMTAPEPCGRGRSAADAIADLERKAGSQFDPQLVAEFAKAVRSGTIEVCR